MDTITGDILELMNDDRVHGYFLQQVNCVKVANAGLAKQIRKAYPGWYRLFRGRGSRRLGDIGIFDITPDRVLVDLYAQYGYGRNERHTDYPALRLCLRTFSLHCEENRTTKWSVYIPYGIGCGLGGGTWRIVEKIISEELGNHPVTLVKLPSMKLRKGR